MQGRYYQIILLAQAAYLFLKDTALCLFILSFFRLLSCAASSIICGRLILRTNVGFFLLYNCAFGGLGFLSQDSVKETKHTSVENYLLCLYVYSWNWNNNA